MSGQIELCVEKRSTYVCVPQLPINLADRSLLEEAATIYVKTHPGDRVTHGRFGASAAHGKITVSVELKTAVAEPARALFELGVIFGDLKAREQLVSGDQAPLLNALEYAYDGLVKMSEHCDHDAVAELGLDFQDCRDQVSFAIERAGGRVDE